MHGIKVKWRWLCDLTGEGRLEHLRDSSGRNSGRAFTDVVSLEALHEPFSGQERVALTASVVFRTARIGAEPDTPVRFELSIRRAVVRLRLPEREPMEIDRSTVARSFILPTIEESVALEQNKLNAAEISGSGSASVKITGIGASAEAKGSVAHEVSDRSTVTFKQAKSPFKIWCTFDVRDGYAWEVESTTQRPLNGPIFPDNQRLADILDTRAQRTGLAPSGIELFVTCAREDLCIEKLNHKNKNLDRKLKQPHKRLVAERYIVDQLIRSGLNADRVDDPYARMTVVSVIA